VVVSFPGWVEIAGPVRGPGCARPAASRSGGYVLQRLRASAATFFGGHFDREHGVGAGPVDLLSRWP
jgi:hypothetical protein